MAMKLPRATIEELDALVEQLTKPEPPVREEATKRLLEYERNGRLPLDALLEFSESENPALSMYAISALGRNGQPPAVKKLLDLAERHRSGNPLFVVQIVDALGETRSATACPLLLSMIGLRPARGKLFGRKPRKEEDEAAAERGRAFMTLPVLRALERIGDAKSAALLGDYLEHAEPLVRWHAIQNLVSGNVVQFNERLRKMADNDTNALVREAASIAMERLEPLPPNLNN